MRIAILTWYYPPKQAGGAELATQNIARQLARRGHESLVITTRDTGLPKESVDERVRVHRVVSLKPKIVKYAYFCLEAVSTLRGFRPDVIHAQGIPSGVPALMGKMATGRPYVVWGRGSDVYMPRQFRGPVLKLILNKSDGVVALTENMKREMQKACKKDILVIGNGVDIGRFGKLPKREARDRLGINEDRKVIVFVGSLFAIKGVKYLIEAMEVIKLQCAETTLLVVGDGPERTMLEAQASSLNLQEQVVFTGRVNNAEVPDFLAAADVFALPSLSEGFPNTIAEAMASGLPVISTKVRGLPEIVAEGQNGFLVASQDGALLAQKILSILDDDRLRAGISLNNRAWATQNTWESVVEKLETVYAKALERTGGLEKAARLPESPSA